MRKFNSEEVQGYLRQCGIKRKAKEAFLHYWVSVDNPLEIIAMAYIFQADDVAEVTHLIYEDIMYVPVGSAPPRPQFDELT